MSQFPSGLTAEAIQKQLVKILASESFRHSDRLSRFLRFGVGMALEGREDELKEHRLGIEVFDRQGSFDPRIDSIVRVEARRLRAKLDKYYDTDGKDDAVLIQFRKGGYVPTFRNRQRAAVRRERAPFPLPDTREWRLIAVLPFTNLSEDPETAYVADGLTQETINAVTKLKNVRVVARTSSSRFKENPRDVRRIGEDLRAEFVLSGTVRTAGTRLRVVAQLASVADETYLWSEAYEREMTDVFAVQAELSQSIVLAVGAFMGVSPPDAVEIVVAGEPWRGLYLKARHCWEKFDPASLERGIALYREALALSPGSSAAWVGLANACGMYAIHGPAATGALIALAREAAQKARELEDTSSETHTTAGMVAWLLDWDWRQADREFVLAAQLDPNSALTRLWYAQFLASRGVAGAAWAEVQRAKELDPVAAARHAAPGMILYLQRDFERAAQEFESALDVDFDYYLAHVGLGWVHTQQSRLDEAFRDFQRAAALSGDAAAAVAGLGYCSGRVGDRSNARGRLEQLRVRQNGSAIRQAEVSLGSGEIEDALRCLESAVVNRDPNAVWLPLLPQFDPLRTHPSFRQLIDTMGVIMKDTPSSGATSATG